MYLNNNQKEKVGKRRKKNKRKSDDGKKNKIKKDKKENLFEIIILHTNNCMNTQISQKKSRERVKYK